VYHSLRSRHIDGRSSPSVRLERRYESRLIADRVEAVAGAIDRDFKDRPLVVVSILKGAAVFMADLTRKMKGPFACEYLHVRRAARAGDIMQIDFTTGFSVKGRHVLLLKDVVHTGITESYLMEHLGDGGGVLAEARGHHRPAARTARRTCPSTSRSSRASPRSSMPATEWSTRGYMPIFRTFTRSWRSNNRPDSPLCWTPRGRPR
jgi:hypothetical protein